MPIEEVFFVRNSFRNFIEFFSIHYVAFVKFYLILYEVCKMLSWDIPPPLARCYIFTLWQSITFVSCVCPSKRLNISVAIQGVTIVGYHCAMFEIESINGRVWTCFTWLHVKRLSLSSTYPRFYHSLVYFFCFHTLLLSLYFVFYLLALIMLRATSSGSNHTIRLSIHNHFVNLNIAIIQLLLKESND